MIRVFMILLFLLAACDKKPAVYEDNREKNRIENKAVYGDIGI